MFRATSVLLVEPFMRTGGERMDPGDNLLSNGELPIKSGYVSRIVSTLANLVELHIYITFQVSPTISDVSHLRVLRRQLCPR